MPDLTSVKNSNIRLAELMAALSIATDLGMGQPMEYPMTGCIVAVRLGEAAGLDRKRTARCLLRGIAALLVAAGQRATATRKEVVAGLSEREVEVLRLLARGNTMKQIAEQLVISYKTVDRHVQNIYTKIGGSTRAGATLFAMEQRLIE